MSVRLVLADDHPMILEGLLSLFKRAAGYDVLATATTGEGALDAIRTYRPDVAVLDIRMPGKTGLEVAAQTFDEGLPTRVVLLTAAIDDEETVEAIRLGVHGVFLKDMALELLLRCVDKVHAGGRWVEHESLLRALEKRVNQDPDGALEAPLLSPAESRVVELVASGALNKEIAERLNVAEGTVKNHLHNIYTKLKLSNRSELARWHMRQRRRG